MATERGLSHRERLELGILALPSFALALAITIVSTQLGEVTRRYTRDTVVIGAIIGGEGAMALWAPVVFGSWSDVLRTRIGGRLPFVLAGGVPAAATLVLIGLVNGMGSVALASALFFLFYFVAYEPYRAMYPDMFDRAISGRAQSAQAVARGLGTGAALLGGGLLLSVARPLPFAFAGLVLVLALGAFVWLLLRRGTPQQDQRDARGPAEVVGQLRRLLARDARLRAYFFANALWEMTLAALKAFIVLYMVEGLGYGLSTASLLIGGVALVILLGAGGSGRLGDRFGLVPVTRIALVAYGAGFILLSVTTNRIALGAAIPLVALGGGTVMTMSYAILVPLMPEDAHGALTGFYRLSGGVGIVLGPVLAGALIELTRGGLYSGTRGYQAMWIVCAAASVLSLWFLRRLAAAAGNERPERRRRGGRAGAAPHRERARA